MEMIIMMEKIMGKIMTKIIITTMEMEVQINQQKEMMEQQQIKNCHKQVMHQYYQ